MSNILLFPGGFKPFHDGHLSIIKSHINNKDNIKINCIRIIISHKDRDNITAESTYNFLTDIKQQLEDYFNVDFIIEISDTTTPIRKCYQIVGSSCSGDMFSLISSNKDNDIIRRNDFNKAYQKDGVYYNQEIGEKTFSLSVNTEPIVYLNDDLLFTDISSTIIRNDIKNNDYSNFKNAYNILLNIISEEQLKTYYYQLYNLIIK